MQNHSVNTGWNALLAYTSNRRHAEMYILMTRLAPSRGRGLTAPVPGHWARPASKKLEPGETGESLRLRQQLASARINERASTELSLSPLSLRALALSSSGQVWICMTTTVIPPLGDFRTMLSYTYVTHSYL